MGDAKLPEARIRPQDGADRMAILRGQARDASVRAGRVAGGVAKVVATLALCGAGLVAIGAGRARPSYDVDKQLESLRRSQRLLETMPKIDYSGLYRDMKLDLHKLSRPNYGVDSPIVIEKPLTPQQRATR